MVNHIIFFESTLPLQPLIRKKLCIIRSTNVRDIATKCIVYLFGFNRLLNKLKLNYRTNDVLLYFVKALLKQEKMYQLHLCKTITFFDFIRKLANRKLAQN